MSTTADYFERIANALEHLKNNYDDGSYKCLHDIIGFLNMLIREPSRKGLWPGLAPFSMNLIIFNSVLNNLLFPVAIKLYKGPLGTLDIKFPTSSAMNLFLNNTDRAECFQGEAADRVFPPLHNHLCLTDKLSLLAVTDKNGNLTVNFPSKRVRDLYYLFLGLDTTTNCYKVPDDASLIINICCLNNNSYMLLSPPQLYVKIHFQNNRMRNEVCKPSELTTNSCQYIAIEGESAVYIPARRVDNKRSTVAISFPNSVISNQFYSHLCQLGLTNLYRAGMLLEHNNTIYFDVPPNIFMHILHIDYSMICSETNQPPHDDAVVPPDVSDQTRHLGTVGFFPSTHKPNEMPKMTSSRCPARRP